MSMEALFLRLEPAYAHAHVMQFVLRKLPRMKGATWLQLRTLFDTALALPSDKRREFLDEACGGNVKIRAEIDALLAADKRNRGTPCD